MASDSERVSQDRILDFDGFPGRWEVTASTADTDGARFETRMSIRERSELPVHVHPAAEERYEVLSGSMDVHADGEWLELTPGEEHVVPPGTAHAFRTTGPVTVHNVHQPAMRFESFFRQFRALKVDRGVAMPPDGLRATILLAMLLTEYDREFVTVSPPQWVMRLLARFGRLRGYDLPE